MMKVNLWRQSLGNLCKNKHPGLTGLLSTSSREHGRGRVWGNHCTWQSPAQSQACGSQTGLHWVRTCVPGATSAHPFFPIPVDLSWVSHLSLVILHVLAENVLLTVSCVPKFDCEKFYQPKIRILTWRNAVQEQKCCYWENHVLCVLL